jgi:hypothetical protein
MTKKAKFILGGLMFSAFFVFSTSESHAWKLFGKETSVDASRATVGTELEPPQVCHIVTVYIFGIPAYSYEDCKPCC